MTDARRTRVAFIGSKSMGVHVLRTLLAEVRPPHALVGAVTLDDREDARSALGELGATAAARGLPLVVASDADGGHSAVADMRPDVVILCGWYAIVPLRRFATSSFFGLHAGPLPRYRGGAPVVWQIIEGQREIGLTLFRLAPRADAGDIVAQGQVPLAAHETVADAIARLDPLAVRLLEAQLPRILDGTVRLRPQDHARATYYPQRSPADGEIDPSWGCVRVHDFVRAQTAPYPGAFARLAGGRILRVWLTEPLPAEHAEPGRVSLRGARATVGCGEGSVRIVSASIDAEPARPPADLLRGVTSLPAPGIATTAGGRAR